MNHTAASIPDETRAESLFRLGLIILIVGRLSPLLIPVLTKTSLANDWKWVAALGMDGKGIV